MKKKLCLLLCCALLLSACGASQESASALPSFELSAAPTEEVSVLEQPWEPYYTGEARDWAQEKPWRASEANDALVDNQDEGLNAYFDLYPGVLGQEDYGGCYINVSGTLTVMLVNPTEERAKEYAEKTEAGFWIIAADYTYQELQDALEQYAARIPQWINDHPEAYLQCDGFWTDERNNRVVVSLSGPSLSPLTDAMDFPNCVEFEFEKTGLASDTHEISHEPETVWRVPKYGITVSMAQETYPVGTDSIAVFLENDSDGDAMYGESFSLEKYIDGQWENVSGNMAFNAVGYGLDAHICRVMQYGTGANCLPTPLGVGLYRLTGGGDISYAPVGGGTSYDAVHTDLGDFTVEFTVTEDAPEPEPLEALEQEARQRLWLPTWELTEPYISQGEDGGAQIMTGPYVAVYWMEGAQMKLTILDRRTGDALLSDPFSFNASCDEGDLIRLRDGSLMVRTPDTVYQIWMDDGVQMWDGAQFPDEDIPYEPISESAAMDYELTAAMEQAVYPAGTETVAFTMTNHSSADLTLETSTPMYTLFRIDYQFGEQNCWYDQANWDTAPIEPEKETLTIPAGQTVRVEIPLALWTRDSEDGSRQDEPLGRGLYQVTVTGIGNNAIAVTPDGQETPARISFALEFALEGSCFMR